MYVCKSVVLALRMYIENIQILRASPREQRTTLRHELLHVSVADSGDGFPSDNQNDFTDHFWHRADRCVSNAQHDVHNMSIFGTLSGYVYLVRRR